MAFLHRKLLFTSETIVYRAFQYPPPPLSHKTLYTSPILLLIVSAVGGVFLLYCYRLIFDKYHSYLNRNTTSLDHTHEDIIDEEHGSAVDHPIWYINTVGLEQSVIDSITVFIYKSHEKLVEGTECSVCLNGFQEDESLRLLPKCSHAFHISCIDTWLRSHKNCPLCRAPIVCVDTLEPNLNEVSVEPQTPLENLETSETRGENNSVLEIDDRKLIDDIAKVGRRELEAMRRSISMVNFALANIHSVGNRGSWGQDNTKRVGLDRRKPRMYRVMIKSCSFRSSVKKGPVCMKRSLSYSGKCAKPRYSRSHDSFLPM